MVVSSQSSCWHLKILCSKLTYYNYSWKFYQFPLQKVLFQSTSYQSPILYYQFTVVIVININPSNNEHFTTKYTTIVHFITLILSRHRISSTHHQLATRLLVQEKQWQMLETCTDIRTSKHSVNFLKTAQSLRIDCCWFWFLNEACVIS